MIYEPVNPELENLYYHYIVMWSWICTAPDITMIDQFAYSRRLDEAAHFDPVLKTALTGLNVAMQEIYTAHA